MGGRARGHQQRFPAGCLYRQGGAGHAIAYANGHAKSNTYAYRHCDGNGDTYCDSHGYCYCNADT